MPEGVSTVIVDYGMGNLRSVEKALAAVGGIRSHPAIRRWCAERTS